MHRPRLTLSLLFVAWLLAAPAAAWALGLGQAPASVVLGQPLDFVVPLRLEGDEPADCLQAEVFVGDQQRALPATVRLRGNGGSAAIRVSTAIAIDEPVVTVQLSAGCLSKVQRRYVVFADPGPVAPSAPVLAQVETIIEPTPTAAGPVLAAANAGAPGPAAGVPPVLGQAAAARAAPTPRAERARERRARAEARREAQRTQRQRGDATPRLAAAQSIREESRPRLRLEAAEPAPGATLPSGGNEQLIDEAIQAVALAASAARGQAAAASASASRIATLEDQLDQVRGQARASQGEIERLRALLIRPQAEAWWLWPLIGLVLLLGLFALWLMWRLRGVQRAQEVAWARASAVVPSEAALRETSPLPLVHSAISGPAPLTPPLTRHASLETAPVPHEITAAGMRSAVLDGTIDTGMVRTMPMPAMATQRSNDISPRDVSIEELIDVDQQAEFFIALGQDHAAIELLVAHLRDTGGGSPLTYLKLLEIYQRQGDEAAYERTRSRFNQRYNAYAPQWGADLTGGKWLEEYDAVLPRITGAWPRPLDAMAELEALLFRKSRGELFDLPAYRDVLFLYSMARDHMERESGGADPVDLLLPLDLSQDPGQALGHGRTASEHAAEDHPTAPLDLDLTPPPRSRDSIFGELFSPTTTPNLRR